MKNMSHMNKQLGAANDYIERFYNPTRLHSTLDYVSPLVFEQRLLLK